MVTIDAAEYNAIVAGATVLERSDDHGPSVWLTADGRVIKAFHRRRRGWLAGLYSYARRFAHHAAKLARRGFRSVSVEHAYRCPDLGSELVIYPKLEGSTLRSLAPGTDAAGRVLGAFSEFLAGLHRAGVHFRGIHFGNVLYDAHGGFALIDVGFMRFQPWPLDVRSRASNFRNILRYEPDAALLGAFGFDAFMQRYLDAAGLGPNRASRLLRLVARAEIGTRAP